MNVRALTVNLLLISDDTRQHYCYLYKHQNMDMLDMCPLNVLILSIQKNHYHLIMSIVNHTKPYKLNFPKWDRKYLLKITIGQCESNLLYMQILSPSHHSYKPANQTLRRAKPISIKTTFPADFVTT